MLDGRTLWDLLERRVDATPDALMVVDEDMETLTFAEYWAEAERAAAGLAAAGVAPGDVVAWQLPSWIETTVLLGALARLGVVQVPLDMSLRSAAIASVLERTGASLLVTATSWDGHDHGATATEVARRVGTARVLLVDRALPQGDPAVIGPPPAEDLDELPVSWIFCTPGRGGLPEGVRHSDRSILAAAGSLCERLELIPRDRHALVEPLCAIEGVAWLVAAVRSGCSNILVGSTDVERTFEVLAREGVTLAGARPETLADVIKAQRSRLEPLFPELRGFTAAEPATSAVDEELRELFEVPAYASYGRAEAPLVTMAALTDRPGDVAATSGTPTRGVEVRLVDELGRDVGTGQVGEIRVRGPQVMRGYLDPSLDARVIDEDGFLRTGDLGIFDDRRNLCVVDRSDGSAASAASGGVTRPGGQPPV